MCDIKQATLCKKQGLANHMEDPNKKTVRVAVIGLGKMGLLHASILNAFPSVRLVALCDKSVIIRRILKKVLGGVQLIDDVEKLVGLDLDASYITTPIPLHFPIAKNIFLKKIARNLFVEKTLASNYNEAMELCEMARGLGSVTMVGYMKRFAVTFRKAKNLLDKETLGDLVSFDAYAYSSDFLGVNTHSKASLLRGGVLRDLGCHMIDLALWFFGDLHVESVTPRLLPEIGSETSLYFEAKKPNGLEGRFSVSQCVENYRMPEIGLSIKGSKGIIDVNDDKLHLKLNDGGTFTWYRHDLNDKVDFWLGAPEYFREDEHFIKSILEGCNAEPSFCTASKVDQVIDQVRYKSGTK